ncbi:MAG: peptidoglycan-binding protein [Christensenellales bacterium]|jgi:cell wall-associated NlpC family hydrolase
MKRIDDPGHPIKTGRRVRFQKGAKAAGALAVSLCMLCAPSVSAAATGTSDDKDTPTPTPETTSVGFFEYTSNVTDAVSFMFRLSGGEIVLDTLKMAMDPLSATVLAEDAGEPSASPGSGGTKTEKKDAGLVPGVHSKKVEEIQERLMELDYMEPDEPTDFYGPQTEYSLQLFQREHDLQVDGIAGAATLELLNSEEAKPYTVRLEARGTDVEGLQERLAELRYFSGRPTGYFGTETDKAVRAFQKRNDLFVDGKVGIMTREALYSTSVKAAPEPQPTVNSSSGNSSSGSSSSGSSSSGSSSSGSSSSGGSSSGSSSSGGSSQSSGSSTTRIPNGNKVSALISVANSNLGKPYVRGGKGPNTFDCSGFVYYCLKSIGVKIGYMTSYGWAGCSYPRVNSMSQLKAGDIICFRGHVAIYIGGGTMIDASSSNGKIVKRSCTGSWSRRNFICGRRVL